MFKRTLLVICMMAALFSVQADPMLYTFDGFLTIEKISGSQFNSEYNISEDIEYNLLINFDDPALTSFGYYDDYTDIYGDEYDFGSVSLEPNGFFYKNDIIDYTALSVIDINYVSWGFGATEIFIAGKNSYGRTNYIKINNTDNDGGLIVGKNYSIVEEYNDYLNDKSYEAKGNIVLTSITDPYQSVPEPGSMTLMFSGILAISGLGFRRKK